MPKHNTSENRSGLMVAMLLGAVSLLGFLTVLAIVVVALICHLQQPTGIKGPIVLDGQRGSSVDCQGLTARQDGLRELSSPKDGKRALGSYLLTLF